MTARQRMETACRATNSYGQLVDASKLSPAALLAKCADLVKAGSVDNAVLLDAETKFRRIMQLIFNQVAKC